MVAGGCKDNQESSSLQSAQFYAEMSRRFAEVSGIMTYVVDFYSGEILMANNQLVRMLGLTESEVIGKRCYEFFGVGGAASGFCPDCPRKRLLSEKSCTEGTFTWERRLDKYGLWVKASGGVTTWGDGRLVHIVSLTDITDIKDMQEQLGRLAYYDRNTDLPNALSFERDVFSGGDNCERQDVKAVCFDLNSLRRVNDIYSREAGDELLVAIRKWLTGLGIGNSRCYRLGGDEFCLAIQGCAADTAMNAAERVKIRFDQPWELLVGGELVNVFCGVTIIVVDVQNPGIQPENFLSYIERGLDLARKIGEVIFFDDKADEDFRDRIKLELSLKKSVKNDMEGFRVVYQPIIDPQTGRWASIEALCRWESPELGTVSPLEFISMAESSNLIDSIGLWVLETAVADCKAWGLDKYDGFFLDVNLSPRQLAGERIAQQVSAILQKHNYPGSKLSLEITESSEINFSNQTLDAILSLKELGLRVALDDFGTGYSSFNNLKIIPVDLVKTERSFISNLENDSFQQYLIYLMSELAHTAEMKLIVEGVENDDQVGHLLRAGVDYMQGYLFSIPLEKHELQSKLEYFDHPMPYLPPHPTAGHSLGDLGGAGSAATISPGLYRILNRCMRLILNESGDRDVNGAFEVLGRGLSLSRVALHLYTGGVGFIVGVEWKNPENSTAEDPTTYFLTEDKEEFIKAWRKRLVKDGYIVSYGLEPGQTDTIEKSGIKSSAACPVWLDGKLVGTLIMECHTYHRHWSREEILLLSDISMLLSSAYKELGQVWLDRN
ncbi:MAG: EAL domain-containing protein [Oscillospiraceae bacterium]|nr:EAL domain-containing protein [Oscillospiraceae bacterium]